jgi:hypothetical protein
MMAGLITGPTETGRGVNAEEAAGATPQGATDPVGSTLNADRGTALVLSPKEMMIT